MKNRFYFSMKSCALALALALTCFTTACQSTPEESPVTGLNSEALESAIAAAPLASYAYDAPPEIHEELKMLSCTFHIDAAVEATGATTHPVYRMERQSFTAAQAERIIDYFVPDAVGIRDASVRTREEIERDILVLQQGVPTLQEDGSIVYMPNEHLDRIMPDLQKLLETAPAEAYDPVTEQTDYAQYRNLFLLRADGRKACCIKADNSIYVSTDGKSAVHRQSTILNSGSWDGEGPVAIVPPISEEQALAAAARVIEELGIKNMGIAWVEPARALDGIGYTAVSTGWSVTYARTEGNNIPFDSDTVSTVLMKFGGDSASYAPDWRQELVSIYVDDTGVRCFAWHNPCTRGDLINENVALLPFDEIYARMEQLVEQGFAWMESPGMKSVKFVVYRIVLTNCLVREENNPDSAIWMPVWMFVYDFATPDDALPGYIAINAIDGSRVQLLD